MRFQAFTSAAVQDGNIRDAIKSELENNLKNGKGKREFTKLVDNIFDSAGLSRLKTHQIDNIYQTNVSLAFGAGQMQAMVEVSEDFPFWKYSAVIDSATRPEHAALHGKIFRSGDFTFFPPIGFRCRCTAIPLTARQAGRYPKGDMPSSSEKSKLISTLESAEFVGNKQKRFIDWLKKGYNDSDDQTRGYIDAAVKSMKKEITKLNEYSTKELIGTEYAKVLERELAADKEVLKNAKALKLTHTDSLRLYAYTDIQNNLASDLAKFYYTDLKPTSWTKNQLLTFKRGLNATLTKLPDAPGVVYRNLDSKHISPDVIKQWTKVGNVIRWDTFSSTTQDKSVYNTTDIRFIINQKNGKDISTLSKEPWEKETLLLPEAGFKVINVEKNRNRFIVEVEEI
ncbi:MAG: minor capsid protein [Rikenellaceae bacterium]